MQKKYRLKKGFQFNYIYRKGKSVSSKELVLYYVKNRSGKLQIGVSVSKKIGKSNVRNRIKRLVKEVARARIDRIDHNYNYIVVARTAAAEADFYQISAALEALFKKAKTIVELSEIPNTSDN